MFGSAYVLLPAAFTSLQAELDRALAAFQRGGEEDLPRDMLTFHDETPELAELHHLEFEVEKGTMRTKAGPFGPTFHLDHRKLKDHLAACNLNRFAGTFAELEPDFDAFVKCFAKTKSSAGALYGRWLNPLGEWDWWDLGGHFNGMITGEARPAAGHQFISSGKSAGQKVLANVAMALGADDITAKSEIELNVELTSTLATELRGKSDKLPSALVLPVGEVSEPLRWLNEPEWRDLPQDARKLLAVAPNSDWRTIVQAVYDRFPAHVAAGVAYHF